MANPQAEDGHVDIANEIVEALAKTYLSSYESQILWSIFRKTYGWHKREDWITGTQLSEMTDIAKSHISRTLKKLIKRNIINRNGKKLSFQKDYDKWERLPKQVTNEKLPIQDNKLPKQVIKVTQTGHDNTQIGNHKRNYTKETSSKENIQEVRNQVSASLKEKPISGEGRKANDIEFDQELLSWHGVDEDIFDDWVKRFPDIDVPVELVKIREHFKSNPRKERGIKNFAIYINDWLERAEKYRIADSEN